VSAFAICIFCCHFHYQYTRRKQAFIFAFSQRDFSQGGKPFSLARSPKKEMSLPNERHELDASGPTSINIATTAAWSLSVTEIDKTDKTDKEDGQDMPRASAPAAVTGPNAADATTSSPTSSSSVDPSTQREMPPLTKQLSKRRFLVLTIFSLLTCSNAIQWIMYAPVPEASKAAFSLNTSELNMLSSIYMIVFVAGFFLSCSVIERQSLRVSLLVGALLNLTGAVMKLTLAVAVPRYAVLLAAQTVLAVSQVFLLSAPPLVADEWFPPNQRGGATAVGSMANNFGIALGMLVAPLMVTQGRSATSTDFITFFVVQVVLAALPVVGIILGMPAHSPTLSQSSQLEASQAAGGDSGVAGGAGATQPPLPSLVEKEASTKLVMLRVARTVLALLQHHDYRILLVSFSVSIGSIWAMSTLLAQILEPFGVSNTFAGLMGAFNLKGGAIFAVGVGRWVDRYRKYKLPLLLASMLNALALSTMCLGLTWWFPSEARLASAHEGMGEEVSLRAKALVFCLYVFAGTAQNTVIPVCFEYAMEATYPLPNSVPGALLMAGGNMVSLILVSCGSAILGPASVATQGDALNAFAMVLSLAGVGGMVVLGAGETLSRLGSGK
jgi:MFS family permease